jgi:ATP-binding cassette, subfamily B, bacterial MsbA
MKLYLRLLKYIKRPEWLNLFASLVCVILLAACNIAIIPISASVTNAIATKNLHELNLIVILVVVLYSVRGLLNYAQVYLMSFAGQRMIIELRLDMFSHLQTLAFDFFSKWRVGDVMSRVIGDTSSLQNIVVVTVTETLPNILTIIGAIVYLVNINPKLTILTLLITPIIALIVSRFSAQLREVTMKTQRKASDISSILAEKLSGIKVVKSYTTEAHEIKKFGQEVEKSFWLIMREIQLDATQKPLIELVQSIAVVLVIWYGAYEVIAGKLAIDHLIAFFVGVGILATPLATLGKLISILYRNLSPAERVFELLDTKPTIADATNAIDMPPIKGSVSFEDVSFHYEKGSPILKNIDFSAKAGEIIAIVGKSGAGKSTFVNLIPRFYDPTSGTIKVDDHDIRDVKLYSLRKQIGTVQQDTVLFLGTIRENISYGKFDATDTEVIAAAKAANIHDFIMGLPEQYDTMVGERGVLLSGGEKQRVSIARAILRDPRILILDEATSSLDTESERLVQDALEKLVKGRTTFIIAHRLSTVQIANRILVFDKGTIIEEGSHHELINKGGKYKMLYDMQFRDDEDAPDSEKEG